MSFKHKVLKQSYVVLGLSSVVMDCGEILKSVNIGGRELAGVMLSNTYFFSRLMLYVVCHLHTLPLERVF